MFIVTIWRCFGLLLVRTGVLAALIFLYKSNSTHSLSLYWA